MGIRKHCLAKNFVESFFCNPDILFYLAHVFSMTSFGSMVNVEFLMMNKALFRTVLLPRHCRFLSHSREGGNLTASTAKYPAITATALHQTGGLPPSRE